MKKRFMLALDQGTTSSRAVVFDHAGAVVALDQREFAQSFPRPGWVEHDPLEIWESQRQVAVNALAAAGLKASDIAGIGVANQRETTLLWERRGGKPLHPAIVWQCRRTADLCAELARQEGADQLVRERTGLLLDPYFSGTKLKWLLDNVPGARRRAEAGELCFGTVDSWLLYQLANVHATEPSNASRTLLFNIHTGRWDDQLLQLLDIPAALLPVVQPSCSLFGVTKLFGAPIPVCGVLGDQQAALFGQGCFGQGDCKCTFGTGCFALLNTGKTPVASDNRLLTTVAWDLGDGLEYALEGSVFIGGAVVKWLRDQLGVIVDAQQTEALAFSVPDNGGVYMVPAFVGLGAPHWDAEARGSVLGLTRGSGVAHIVRAALESVAYQTKDLVDALRADFRGGISSLKIDGGASVNGFLAQFLADVLGIPVVRPAVAETTALGAAYVAGLQCGFWSGEEALAANWSSGAEFKPRLDPATREALLRCWANAVEATRRFKG